MPVETAADLLETLSRGEILSATQLAELKQVPKAQSSEALAQDLVRRGWITAFQARHLLLGRGDDLVLGQYQLIDNLGKGGWSQVYRARQRSTSRVVAVKVLRSNLLQNSEAVQRFRREIEAIARMKHPNIAEAVEAGPLGNHLVLVLEFVDGVDLNRMVEESGPLPIEQACEYIRQAASALQYVHEQGLVHRDIKPSNLIVRRAGDEKWGVVKLVDFGLARLHDTVKAGSLTLEAGNATQGTPDYMAPEQALDFHSADIRCDVYSLGCVLYFLLTGRPLFTANTLAEKLMKHQRAEPAIAREWPQPLQVVLRRLLAKRPEDRYATPGDAARALAALASAPTSSAAPVDRWAPAKESARRLVVAARDFVLSYRQRPWTKKQKIGLAAGGLSLVLALGCFAFVLSTPASPKDKGGDGPVEPPEPPVPVARIAVDKGLVSYFTFDEKSGDTVADTMGQAASGKLVDVDLSRCWVPGRVGNAIQLGGGNERIEIPDSPALKVGRDNGDFTVAFWIFLIEKQHPEHRALFHKGANNDQRTFAIWLLPNTTRLHYRISTTVNNSQGGDTQAGLEVNRWTHVAYVKKGNYLSLYLDGVGDSGAALGGPVVVNDGPLYIGKDPWHPATHARFDDLRIYNRALEAREVKILAR